MPQESWNSTACQTTSEPDFAAFVGLDWADQKHWWKLAEAGSQRYEQGQIKNTPETSRFGQPNWIVVSEGAR